MLYNEVTSTDFLRQGKILDLRLDLRRITNSKSNRDGWSFLVQYLVTMTMLKRMDPNIIHADELQMTMS